MRGDRDIWHPQYAININDWALRRELHQADLESFQQLRDERELQRRQDGTYHTYPREIRKPEGWRRGADY